MARVVGRFQFVERGNERFGHIAPAKRSESIGGMTDRVENCVAHLRCLVPRIVERAATMNASMATGSLTPGLASTPEDTSTTSGASKRRRFGHVEWPETTRQHQLQ